MLFVKEIGLFLKSFVSVMMQRGILFSNENFLINTFQLCPILTGKIFTISLWKMQKVMFEI